MKNTLTVTCETDTNEAIDEVFLISKVVTIDTDKDIIELRQLKDGKYQLTIPKRKVVKK